MCGFSSSYPTNNNPLKAEKRIFLVESAPEKRFFSVSSEEKKVFDKRGERKLFPMKIFLLPAALNFFYECLKN